MEITLWAASNTISQEANSIMQEGDGPDVGASSKLGHIHGQALDYLPVYPLSLITY